MDTLRPVNVAKLPTDGSGAFQSSRLTVTTHRFQQAYRVPACR